MVWFKRFSLLFIFLKKKMNTIVIMDSVANPKINFFLDLISIAFLFTTKNSRLTIKETNKIINIILK